MSNFGHPFLQFKGYKTHRGHEGEPLGQCSARFDGKPLALCSDGDWGGPFQVLLDPKVDATLLSAVEAVARRVLDQKTDLIGNPYKADTMDQRAVIDEFLERAFYEFQEQMEIRGHIKNGKAIAVRVQFENGTEDTKIYKVPYTASNVERIRKEIEGIREAKGIKEIINKTMGFTLISEQSAEEDRFRKLCKTRTLFRIIDEKGDTKVMVIAKLYDPQIVDRMRTKYGSNFKDCVNEVYGVPPSAVPPEFRAQPTPRSISDERPAAPSATPDAGVAPR